MIISTNRGTLEVSVLMNMIWRAGSKRK
uniref:Uncharacterized protein n=1 Tax=Rhizophora mucronata TaxID=61149 RepID=A0A2P2PNF0_RHIMU